MKASGSFYLRLAVTAVCYAVLLWRADLGLLAHALARMDWIPYLLALALLGSGQALSALKWKLLAGCVGIVMTWLRAFRFYLIGMFFHHFMPTAIGGDIVRILIVSRSGIESPRVTSSVFMERDTGLISMLVIASAAAWYAGLSLNGIPYFIPFICALAAAIAANIILFAGIRPHWLERVPLAGSWLRDGVVQIGSYKTAHGTLAVALVMSAIYQITVITKHYLYARAIGPEIPYTYFLVFVPVISVAGMLPISLNGLGVREATMVALYTSVGATQEQALSMGILHLSLLMLSAIPGGVLYLLGERGRARLEGPGR